MQSNTELSTIQNITDLTCSEFVSRCEEAGKTLTAGNWLAHEATADMHYQAVILSNQWVQSNFHTV